MPFAITHYVTQSNNYVQYLHWNNNGIMDGFIDLKNDMPFLNDEYELRKKIYGKRFDVYTSTNDFIKFGQINLLQYWQNHYSNKLMDFFLPESSYIEKTMKMPDDYYQRALQYIHTYIHT